MRATPMLNGYYAYLGNEVWIAGLSDCGERAVVGFLNDPSRTIEVFTEDLRDLPLD